MKFSSLIAIATTVQSAAVITTGDCSDLYATCPITDCCGTGTSNQVPQLAKKTICLGKD